MNPPPEGVANHDFEAIEAAVMETERGRWFLAEFARRLRNEDTSRILAALERIEARVEAEQAPSVKREIDGATGDASPPEQLRPRDLLKDAPTMNSSPSSALSLQQRFAGLVQLDALDVEAKLRLFG